MAEPLDLDARLDELFGAEPKEFTAVRDALVRDLKADDRADEATAVKSLRKPTVAVAAINQAVRQQPDQVEALVEVGAEHGDQGGHLVDGEPERPSADVVPPQRQHDQARLVGDRDGLGPVWRSRGGRRDVDRGGDQGTGDHRPLAVGEADRRVAELGRGGREQDQ